MGEVIALPNVFVDPAEADAKIIMALQQALDRAAKAEFSAVCVVGFKHDGQVYYTHVRSDGLSGFGLLAAVHQAAFSMHAEIENSDDGA